MASLAKQRQVVLNLLERASAAFKRLAEESTGAAAENFKGLYGGWVCRGLTDATEHVRQIKPEVVRDLRKAGQPTHPVFETHLSAAKSALRDQHGTLYSVDELFKKSADYSAYQIRGLDLVKKSVGKALRRMTILRSRLLSVLTSGLFLSALLVLALISIPAYRYGSVYLHARMIAATAVTPQEAVSAQAQRDFTKVQSNAQHADKSPLKRTADVLKDVWTLMDLVPKILTALSAVWGVVLLWLRR
jgi:hypothetical protein